MNDLQQDIEVVRAFIADELAMRKASYLPDPDDDEVEYIAEAEKVQLAFERIAAAVSK